MIERMQRHVMDCCGTAVIYKTPYWERFDVTMSPSSFDKLLLRSFTSPDGVYHHFMFKYFRVLHVKLSCRLAVSRAQDEWRASNLLQDIYCLHMTVYICGDL